MSTDNVVVSRQVRCPKCGTVFHCNRAEPYCIGHHPGRWHLQVIDFAAAPCEHCDSWLAPWAEMEARLSVADATGADIGEGLLFPMDATTPGT